MPPKRSVYVYCFSSHLKLIYQPLLVSFSPPHRSHTCQIHQQPPNCCIQWEGPGHILLDLSAAFDQDNPTCCLETHLFLNSQGSYSVLAFFHISTCSFSVSLEGSVSSNCHLSVFLSSSYFPGPLLTVLSLCKLPPVWLQ